jgi:hypothetical protein
MATYPRVPTGNNKSYTLDAQIAAGATSLTLNQTVAGVVRGPGYCVIDRIDSSSNLTPTKREYKYFTGVSGANLTGLTTSDGTDQVHAVGAIVEFVPNVGDENDKYSVFTTEHSDLGQHGSLPSLSYARVGNLIGLSQASLNTLNLTSLKLPTAGNIQVNAANSKRTMYVSASAMYPSTTAPCASITQVESSTNDVNIKVLDFDGAGSSKEYAEFGIQSPTYWDASTVTAQFIWYATAGSGTVNWEIQGLALSDDDALDTAYGTLQEVTDTLIATGDVHITSETAAITIAGTPVAGDWLQFKIARDPANDTNTSDARLMGVRIRFGIAQYNDA